MKFDYAKRLGRLRKFAAKRGCAVVLTAAEGFDANAYYYSGDETFPTTLLDERLRGHLHNAPAGLWRAV